MASTRNKNTGGNYKLEQRAFEMNFQHNTSQNSSYGCAHDPGLFDLGVNPSGMCPSNLSHNPIEIESALFGINSTNLVNPQPPTKPQFKKVKQQSYFDKTPMIMPEPMVVENNQRPFPI